MMARHVFSAASLAVEGSATLEGWGLLRLKKVGSMA